MIKIKRNLIQMIQFLLGPVVTNKLKALAAGLLIGSYLAGNVSVAATLSTTDTLATTAAVLDPVIITPIPPIIVPPKPVISVRASDPSAREGGADNGAFTISSSTAAPRGGIFVNFQLSGTATQEQIIVLKSGGAPSTPDYGFIGGSATIPAGATSVTVPVRVLDDSEIEPTETVVLTLNSDIENTYIVGNASSATVNIADNDSTPGVVSFLSASYSIDEDNGAGRIAIEAERTNGTTGEIEVVYAINLKASTASLNEDYSIASGTSSGKFIWGDGVGGKKQFHITVKPDTQIEPDETVVISLAQPTGGAALGQIPRTSLTIRNDDVAQAGRIEWTAATATVGEEAGQVTLLARRVGGKDGELVANYATANGTATAGQDFVGKQGTVRFADQDTANKSVDISITDDTEQNEGNEQFSVNLTSPAGGPVTVGGATQATVTIVENDTGSPGVLQLSNASYNVNEGGGNLTLTVTRSGGTVGAASVRLSTGNGTATAGQDFAAANPVLNWAAGEGGNRSVTIPISEDTEVEGNETFSLALSQATGASLGAVSEATVTIVDNDVAGVVQFSAASYDVAENAASVNVLVTRSGGSAGAASVQVATSNGTATAGQDYTAKTETVRWAAGESGNRTVTIALSDDNDEEGTETINVALSNASGVQLAAPATAQVRIADVENSGALQFSTTAYSGDESSGAVTITVNRVGGTAGAASVQVATSNGTATAGQDYTAGTDTLNWAAGDSSAKTFTVPILTDTDDTEGDETVNLTLSNATGASLGTPTQARLTIRAQALPPGEVSVVEFVQGSFQANESGGTATAQIQRTGSPVGAISVRYIINGESAQENQDYTGQSGTVTWPDGDTSPKVISITLLQDEDLEGDETIELLLMEPNGADLGALFRTTLTIQDDEVDSGPLSSLSGVIGQTVVQQFMVSNAKSGIRLTAETGTVEPAFIEGSSGMVTYTYVIPANATIGDVINDSITITDADNNETLVTAKIAVQDEKITEAAGLNKNQTAVLNALNDVCDDTTNALLQARCAELNALTPAQQQQALDAIAPDEVAAMGIQTIEITTIQLSNLRTRLAAVREGSRGFAFNGLQWQLGDDAIPVGSLYDGVRRQGQGGAAGDELLGESSRLGGFINGRINTGDKDSTDLETGFDYDKQVITLGVDYRVNNQLFVGGALGISSLEADFAGPGGDLSSDATNFAFYGSYFNEKNYFLDWIVSFGNNDYETTRNIAYSGFAGGSVEGDTSGSQTAFSINAGLDKQKGDWLLSPYARFEYVSVDIDAYQESGTTGLELAIRDQTVDSMTIALGSRVAKPMSRPWGVLTPSADLAMEYEFADDARQITSSFVGDSRGVFTIDTDEPDRLYFNVGLSVAAQFQAGRAVFVRYDTVIGKDDVSDSTIEAGLRMEF